MSIKKVEFGVLLLWEISVEYSTKEDTLWAQSIHRVYFN